MVILYVTRRVRRENTLGRIGIDRAELSYTFNSLSPLFVPLPQAVCYRECPSPLKRSTTITPLLGTRQPSAS